MQANCEMPPHKQNEKDLSKTGPGIHPKIRDLVRIIDVDAGQDSGAASIDDVNEQQIWDRESENNLGSLPHRHPMMSASSERG